MKLSSSPADEDEDEDEVWAMSRYSCVAVNGHAIYGYVIGYVHGITYGEGWDSYHCREFRFT